MNLARARKILVRGLLLRCPACGEGGLYQSAFRMRERCARCGLVFAREQGYFVGAIYVNVILTETLILAVFLGSLIFTSGASDRVYFVMFAAALVLPLAFYRFSRSLWLAFDHIVSPPPDAKEKRTPSHRRNGGGRP